MTSHTRIARIARASGYAIGKPGVIGPAVLANCDYIFDPAWLRHIAAQDGAMLTLGGVPVVANCRTDAQCAAVEQAMLAGRPVAAETGLDAMAFEDGASIVNTELRKREQPFAMRLEPSTVRAAERASYFGAYKGVTDLLTKYLWPEWALVLTRIAARIGMTPNMVTTVGAILCVLATIAFYDGHYWAGLAAGLAFMVLDTVDGKLARCTITSSKLGNAFDHGMDLIHPPFWWYAWGVGLHAYGRPLDNDLFAICLVAIIGGYVLQRLIEGAFIALYGMHIHVWQKADSDFRLITARRNPNMVILFASVVISRPDLGLVAVAAWTVLSLLFHAVRLIQAWLQARSGRPVRSWLDGDAPSAQAASLP